VLVYKVRVRVRERERERDMGLCAWMFLVLKPVLLKPLGGVWWLYKTRMVVSVCCGRVGWCAERSAWC